MLAPDATWLMHTPLQQAKAYYKPVVTDSNEAFDWGSVDLDGLRMYVQSRRSAQDSS